jgi:hypothetical protein
MPEMFLLLCFFYFVFVVFLIFMLNICCTYVNGRRKTGAKHPNDYNRKWVARMRQFYRSMTKIIPFLYMKSERHPRLVN